jgi:hypothetical protein
LQFSIRDTELVNHPISVWPKLNAKTKNKGRKYRTAEKLAIKAQLNKMVDFHEKETKTLNNNTAQRIPGMQL